jgi:glycosyltransferase involved in cell wall biosynthesis
MQQAEVAISVLMPVYNGAAYIAEAIQSVLEQTFTDFELIIVDDGSVDDTVNIISTFYDTRIVLLKRSHEGIAASLNYGIENAKGKFIARFDADDICYPNRLAIQYEFLQTNSNYNIVGSSADYTDEQGEFVFTYQPPALSNINIQSIKKTICPFVHSSVMFRKDALENDRYNSFAHAFEDHLLWLQLLQRGKAFNIATPLISVRLNPASITIDDKWRSKNFHSVKKQVLEQENISAEQGAILKNIITGEKGKQKQAAYAELIGKKFLWNNYSPIKARSYFKTAMKQHFAWRVYFLYCFSFFPATSIKTVYKLIKQ